MCGSHLSGGPQLPKVEGCNGEARDSKSICQLRRCIRIAATRRPTTLVQPAAGLDCGCNCSWELRLDGLQLLHCITAVYEGMWDVTGQSTGPLETQKLSTLVPCHGMLPALL